MFIKQYYAHYFNYLFKIIFDNQNHKDEIIDKHTKKIQLIIISNIKTLSRFFIRMLS